jgi:hypothetical protein
LEEMKKSYQGMYVNAAMPGAEIEKLKVSTAGL